MTDRRPQRRGYATRALLALLMASALGTSARAAEPWEVLAETRTQLIEAGGLVADFVQTFVPAGFSDGEREVGRLFLALPDCLRWDYEIPYPRSFLICGEEIYAWNPGEGSGRRSTIDADEEPGLDLLMLSVDRLTQRYAASEGPRGEGEMTVQLEPLDDSAAFAEAVLVIDTRLARPRRLSYRDREGNESVFELSGFRPLGEASAVFERPAGIEWID